MFVVWVKLLLNMCMYNRGANVFITIKKWISCKYNYVQVLHVLDLCTFISVGRKKVNFKYDVINTLHVFVKQGSRIQLTS